MQPKRSGCFPEMQARLTTNPKCSSHQTDRTRRRGTQPIAFIHFINAPIQHMMLNYFDIRIRHQTSLRSFFWMWIILFVLTGSSFQLDLRFLHRRNFTETN
jgi:hypothetical protein